MNSMDSGKYSTRGEIKAVRVLYIPAKEVYGITPQDSIISWQTCHSNGALPKPNINKLESCLKTLPEVLNYQ